MKKISVVGENSTPVKMFIMELAWVLSGEHRVYFHISDDAFYKRFSINNLDSTDLGKLTLINNYNEVFFRENEADFLVSDEYCEDSDYVLFVLTQSIFGAHIINLYSQLTIRGEKNVVYLDFIDCPFDEDYFKNYHIDKILLDDIKNEITIEFDERVAILQIENQLNRVLNLKQYPRQRKRMLLSVAEIFEEEVEYKYKEYYRKLDSRVSVC